MGLGPAPPADHWKLIRSLKCKKIGTQTVLTKEVLEAVAESITEFV